MKNHMNDLEEEKNVLIKSKGIKTNKLLDNLPYQNY